MAELPSAQDARKILEGAQQYLPGGGVNQSGTAIDTGAEIEKFMATVYPSQGDLLQSTTANRLGAKEDSDKLDSRLEGLDPSVAEGQPVNVPGQETTTEDAQPKEEVDPYTQYLDEEKAAIDEAYQADIDYTNQQFDRLVGLVDTSTNALLKSIRSTYQARISEMQQKNKALYGAKRQSGIRTGRSRYMQETEEAFLSDEENAGLARIGQLEGEMLGLIAEAETARTKDQIDILNDRMTELARVDEDMKTQVQNLHKNVLARQEELRLQRKLELDEQKAAFDKGLEQAEASARAVADALGTFESEEEKLLYLEKAAEKLGVGTDVLYSKALEAMDDVEKAALDTRNIESQIASREATARTSAYNASLREREVSLKEKEADGTVIEEDDLASLAREGVPAGVAQDFQQAMQRGDNLDTVKKYIADQRYEDLLAGKISNWDTGTMETMDQALTQKARKDADEYAEKMYNSFIKYFESKDKKDDF